MTLAEYYALIADLPRPTKTQLKCFAEHVCYAHSWYKHLPFDGAEFVVFVDPDAGGRFTEDQPRLHHTWQTRAQYLERFGYLSYMHRAAPSAPFGTDYSFNALVDITKGVGRFVNERITPELPIPREIHEDCHFTLYPFVWDNGVFFWRFEKLLRELCEGERCHPCESLLIDYYRRSIWRDECHAHLHDEVKSRYAAGVPCRGQVECAGSLATEAHYWYAEREYILELAREAEARASLSDRELAFALAENECRDAQQRMEEHERAKIADALNRLMVHMDSVRGSFARR
jgi:hypothetical protein